MLLIIWYLAAVFPSAWILSILFLIAVFGELLEKSLSWSTSLATFQIKAAWYVKLSEGSGVTKRVSLPFLLDSSRISNKDLNAIYSTYITVCLFQEYHLYLYAVNLKWITIF